MRKRMLLTKLVAAISSKKRIWAIFLIIILLAVGVYFFRSLFIVATVNGQPIWRLTLIRELEKQSGKEALDTLISKTLVLQEAKKQNAAVSGEEIDQEIKKLEENFSKQGQDLNQLLSTQGISREELMEEVRFQKIVEKIVGKDINVTDQEVSNYLKQNENLLPKDSNTEELKSTVKRRLEQQKMNEKIQSWIESLQDSAKIIYFR
ncbi:hypothetical protein CO054_00110 [Candidatus Shapirobacteria bacterium CG_4_9_14_0_2_um_filter_39_11]|uniref:peptidylprolyl isomerase n=1 Tax=Candidatus Shapirobacteria bacterium CG_4_9_14_0_2_um_filter_39_11 TaxID=1974478 RepID=A0A2M8ETJ9_9BACT|nr:MAG: hypothetical protein CO054_00110 [Candidatus Shapirobacteria bacterium CG_4_9_14_0_2_um_filter_39_11]